MPWMWFSTCNLQLLIMIIPYITATRSDLWGTIWTNVESILCWYMASSDYNELTHWGRVTDICIGKLTIIGSDNGLLPAWRQAIISTNARILLIGPLGTNFSEILIGIQTFSFTKMHLKMSSAKWRPFCLGPNELNTLLHMLRTPSVYIMPSNLKIVLCTCSMRNVQLQQNLNKGIVLSVCYDFLSILENAASSELVVY